MSYGNFGLLSAMSKRQTDLESQWSVSAGLVAQARFHIVGGTS